MPQVFHWDLTAFPIPTHHCACSTKKYLKQIRSGRLPIDILKTRSIALVAEPETNFFYGDGRVPNKFFQSPMHDEARNIRIIFYRRVSIEFFPCPIRYNLLYRSRNF